MVVRGSMHYTYSALGQYLAILESPLMQEAEQYRANGCKAEHSDSKDGAGTGKATYVGINKYIYHIFPTYIIDIYVHQLNQSDP